MAALIGAWSGSDDQNLRQALTDADLDGYMRRTAIAVHHPLSSCRMGHEPDAGAVGSPTTVRQGGGWLLGHKAAHVTTHYSAADISNLIAASEQVCDLGSRKSPAIAIVRAHGVSQAT